MEKDIKTLEEERAERERLAELEMLAEDWDYDDEVLTARKPEPEDE